MAKVSLEDEAYSILKDKLCNFEFIPGQVLSDYTISKELNMSRTPIRQALQRLMFDGLIAETDDGKKRYIVEEITEEEIDDLFEVREIMEITALKLGSQKGITKTQINELEEIIKKMDKADSEGRIKDNFFYDQEFHNTLVALSRNNKLIKMHAELQVQLSRTRVLSSLRRELQRKAVNDHTEVIKALKKKDYSKAEDILRQHILSTKSDYKGILNQNAIGDSYRTLQYLMKFNVLKK